MFAQLPFATRGIAIVIVLAFVAQQVWPGQMLAWFGLWPDIGPILVERTPQGPILARFEPWQFLSHGFLHGGFAHLLLNGLALVMFGAVLERAWGALRFSLFFVLCVIGGGLAQWWWTAAPTGNEVTVTLGASGGLFGVLGAFAIMFPRHRLMLIFPPIPMPAWLLVSLFVIASTVMGITGMVGGIAHFAHLGGIATGVLLYVLFARRWRRDGFRAADEFSGD
jgi:membrane associated rhomboid family serine protease